MHLLLTVLNFAVTLLYSSRVYLLVEAPVLEVSGISDWAAAGFRPAGADLGCGFLMFWLFNCLFIVFFSAVLLLAASV